MTFQIRIAEVYQFDGTRLLLSHGIERERKLRNFQCTFLPQRYTRTVYEKTTISNA
jgi:hypothetical protein